MIQREGFFGVYVHTPFCKKRCKYCDYLTYEGREERISAYLMAVCQELGLRSASADRPVTSIYFGGGTPELLGASGLEFLAGVCRERFVLASDVEWTIEANPDTISAAFLEKALSVGVNRISIGVEALNDNLLELLGRSHTSRQAREAFLLASGLGFKNISIDLLYGVPAQTPDDFVRGLEEVVEWDPQHLSLYALTVAPGTILFREYEEGGLPLAPEPLVADMYGDARDLLTEAGYEHYEISSFARTGFESLHNLNYWDRGSYLGVGVGAESHIGSTRLRNIEDLEEYVRMMEAGGPLDRIIRDREDLTVDLAAKDALISALRTRRGIDVEEYDERFGTSVLTKHQHSFQSLVQAGLIELGEGRLRLSSKGQMLSHLVFQEFL